MNQQVYPKRLVELLPLVYLWNMTKFMALSDSCTFSVECINVLTRDTTLIEFIYKYIYFKSGLSVLSLFSALVTDKISARVQQVHRVFLFFYADAEREKCFVFF